MQTKVIGGGVGPGVIQPGVEQAVDPKFWAARVAFKPDDYTAQGVVLGHYAVGQVSGAVAATLGAGSATGTAVALPVGAGSPLVTVYECTAFGQHPVVLAANEGVIAQNIAAGAASGTYQYYLSWEWAEVVVF